MKKTKSSSRIVVPMIIIISALLHIVASIGVVHAMDYYLYYTYLYLHWAICIISFIIGYSLAITRVRTASKLSKIIKVVAPIIYILALVILIGFRQYVAGIILSTLITAVSLIAYLCHKYGKKGIIGAVATVMIGVAVSYPAYFLNVIEVGEHTKNADLTTSTDSSLAPYGKQAETLYVCDWNSQDNDGSYSNIVFFKGIQGYLSLTCGEQMYFVYGWDREHPEEHELPENYDSYDSMQKYAYDRAYQIGDAEKIQIDLIDRYYDTQIVDDLGIYDALDKVAHNIKNYILCDSGDLESITVATSLCNQMDAIPLPQDKLKYAEKYGWKQVFSTIGKNKNWLVSSNFFDKINKNLAIVCLTYLSTNTLIDYTIVSNAWFVTQFETETELAGYCQKMNRGFRLFGTRYSETKEITENAVVSLVAKYSGTYFYSWGMTNLATMTGFRLENASGTNSPLNRQVNTVDYSTQKVENKHTVCIMFSDGDNMQYDYENNLTNGHQFGSPNRAEDSSATYGMSGLMIELTPIMLIAYYERLYPTEGLAMALSSNGYTYPSKWNDDEAFNEVLYAMEKSMQTADIHVVEIMDDISFMNGFEIPCMYDTMQKYFDKYTALDQVEGCLFIGYHNQYRGYQGQICWSNGKPVVAARYGIWNDDDGMSRPETDLQYVAEHVNSASSDVTSEDAYSFIIMHAWSGIDDNGNLVAGGDCMQVITELTKMFDDDVEIVGCDEFINRIKNNVIH